MSASSIGLVVVVGLTVGLFCSWAVSVTAHQRRMRQLDVCIHVNGIRGKSTVTRLVAAALREGGMVSLGKTTGSAARVIGPWGQEVAIFRRGAATINEQIDVVAEHVTPDVRALVIECMAVRPLYQQYSQDHIVRSNITIITNVREDHQEEMGETHEAIADSLCATVPTNGLLITAEERADLRVRMERHARARGSGFLYADPAWVDDEAMLGFDHLQFKENVAIGYALADLLGISRQRALEGMWRAVPDIGVVRFKTYSLRGKRVLWIPLFAANDRESVVSTLRGMQSRFPVGAPVLGILNNRKDRGRRAELFAHLIPQDVPDVFDHVITMGAFEDIVSTIMVGEGYPRERIHLLGDSVNPTRDEMLDEIAALMPGDQGVLIGMVNIHTHQAEELLEFFHEQAGEADEDPVGRGISSARAPIPALWQAQSQAAGRLALDRPAGHAAANRTREHP